MTHTHRVMPTSHPRGCETGVMDIAPGVAVDGGALDAFCRRNGIRRLKLFGSALGDRFRPSSDIDLLVEFEEDRVPGLLRMAALELELGAMLGRAVDLRTVSDLSRYFRDRVATDARLLYDAA